MPPGPDLGVAVDPRRCRRLAFPHLSAKFGKRATIQHVSDFDLGEGFWHSDSSTLIALQTAVVDRHGELGVQFQNPCMPEAGSGGSIRSTLVSGQAQMC